MGSNGMLSCSVSRLVHGTMRWLGGVCVVRLAFTRKRGKRCWMQCKLLPSNAVTSFSSTAFQQNWTPQALRDTWSTPPGVREKVSSTKEDSNETCLKDGAQGSFNEGNTSERPTTHQVLLTFLRVCWRRRCPSVTSKGSTLPLRSVSKQKAQTRAQKRRRDEP